MSTVGIVIFIIVILLLILFIGWFYYDTRCRFKRCRSRGTQWGCSDPCGSGSGLKGPQGEQGPQGVQAKQTTQFTFTPADASGGVDGLMSIDFDGFAVVTFGDADTDFLTDFNTQGGLLDRFSGIFGKSGYISNFRTFLRTELEAPNAITTQLYWDTTSSGNVPNFLPIPELKTLTPNDGQYYLKTPDTPALIPVAANTRFALVLTAAPPTVDDSTSILAFTASFDFTAN